MRKSPIHHTVHQHTRSTPEGAVTIQSYERGQGSRKKIPKRPRVQHFSGLSGNPSDYSVTMKYDDGEEVLQVSAPDFSDAATEGMTKRKEYRLPLIVRVGVVE